MSACFTALYVYLFAGGPHVQTMYYLSQFTEVRQWQNVFKGRRFVWLRYPIFKLLHVHIQKLYCYPERVYTWDGYSNRSVSSCVCVFVCLCIDNPLGVVSPGQHSYRLSNF